MKAGEYRMEAFNTGDGMEFTAYKSASDYYQQKYGDEPTIKND